MKNSQSVLDYWAFRSWILRLLALVVLVGIIIWIRGYMEGFDQVGTLGGGNVRTGRIHIKGVSSFSTSQMLALEEVLLLIETIFGGRATNRITHNPSPSASVWDQLPDEITGYIFAKLCIADRVRMMSVCKSWRYTLMQDHIPVAPEPPWRIFSHDSYTKPEYSLHEICFVSFDDDYYRFKLPIGGRWWCCGSSDGWLLMAGCDWDENRHDDSDIILWNPISGAIRKLPAPSTLGFFWLLIQNGLDEGIVSISRFIRRVHVFSVESAECVVAVIFEDPTMYPYNYLALCTPHDQSWSVVDEEEANIFNDICFHNGKLYASCKKFNGLEPEANETITRAIRLKDCDVQVNVLRLIYEGELTESFFLPDGFSKHERIEIVDHLVPEISGELLVVSAICDLCSYMNEDPIVPFIYSETNKFEVRRLVEGDCFEKLDGIGEQAIFVGSKSSVSVDASVDGVEAEGIYFAMEDAHGVIVTDLSRPLSHRVHDDLDNAYRVHEQGFYDLRQNLIEKTSVTNLRMQSGSTTGWFTPKLF